MSKIRVQMIDQSSELSAVTLQTNDLGAADVWGGWATIASQFATHLEAISLLPVYTGTFTQITDNSRPPAPTVAHADREAAVRIVMRGNDSGKLYSISVPAPDQSVLARLPGTDLYDLADEPLASFVTFLQTQFDPPYGATVEGVTVLRAVHVGRNN